MLDPGIFLDKLRALGVEFFTGVPDSLLRNFCAELAALPDHVRVTAANEGGGRCLGRRALSRDGGACPGLYAEFRSG